MLAPDNRRVLLEVLRPPEGYVVDRAIATTYTLDLVALLTAPVAFSLYDSLLAPDQGAATDAADTINPYALIEAVRSHAKRLTVFCQSGRISLPAKFRRLFTYLEPSVVEVRSPQEGGVFHPKLWIVRYVNEEESVLYRVLVSSRNLTFDQSWDTLVVLDGELTDRANAIAANHPLADFVAALPGLAVSPMQETGAIEEIADELRRTRFELPLGFDELSFHPVGIEDYTDSPFDTRVDRLLVVSPFVAAGALKDLTESGSDHVLVSRMEELLKLPSEALEDFKSVHVLHDSADHLEGTESEQQVEASLEWPPPVGLHAKLFVADDGWNAHLWTGSLNATNAALHQNVEFLVRFSGKKSQVGVDAILEGNRGADGLAKLLAPFNPPESPVEADAVEAALEEAIRATRDRLSRLPWRAVVGPVNEKQYPFQLTTSEPLALDEGVEVVSWPISVGDTLSQRVVPGASPLVVDFGLRSFESLTSFFAFRLHATKDGRERQEEFVLNVPLEGAPDDRESRVLHALLDDPEKVLRFLRMLLALDPLEILNEIEPGHGGDSSPKGQGGGRSELPLLESLMRTLDRNPARIDTIAQFVADLSATAESKALLPPEFLAVWDPIHAARQTLKEGGR